jgi:hypothetical protein
MSYELSEDERDAIREEAKRDAYERKYGAEPETVLLADMPEPQEGDYERLFGGAA